METLKLEKWTPAQLIGRMLSTNWHPLPSPGLWIHSKTGYQINLHEVMKDGRLYWEQLAERNQLPPTEAPPF